MISLALASLHFFAHATLAFWFNQGLLTDFAGVCVHHVFLYWLKGEITFYNDAIKSSCNEYIYNNNASNVNVAGAAFNGRLSEYYHQLLYGALL